MIACPFPYLLHKTAWILSGAKNSCYFCLQIRHCQIIPKTHKRFPSTLKLIFASPQQLNDAPSMACPESHWRWGADVASI